MKNLNLEPTRKSLSDPLDLVFQREMTQMDDRVNQEKKIIRENQEAEKLKYEEKKRNDKEEWSKWSKEKTRRDNETGLMMGEDYDGEQLRTNDQLNDKLKAIQSESNYEEFRKPIYLEDLEDLMDEQQDLAQEIEAFTAQKSEDELTTTQAKSLKKL